jgi:hypothetical protein
MFDEFVAVAMAASGGEAVGAWARVENAACARRLSAIADVLEARWAEARSADRDQWCLDNWDAVAAEVRRSRCVAGGRVAPVDVGDALRERLPQVAEMFGAGHIALRLVNTIVHRTALIADPKARAKVDIELAAAVTGWGRLSEAKVEQAIDYWVDRYDPYALRRMERRARGRHVDWTWSDGAGCSTIEAVLFDYDAAALDKRLDAMARAVCDGDARTKDQRRADALGALAASADRLACACGAGNCPAATEPANAVVINVIADEKTLSDDTPVTLDGENPRQADQADQADTGDGLGRDVGITRTDRPVAHHAGGDDRRADRSRAVVGGQSRCRRHDPTGDSSRRRSTRTGLSAVIQAGSVRALPRYDMPVPWLQGACRRVRS